MTLNVLSYQHQQAYAPASGMCQAAPAFNHNHTHTHTRNHNHNLDAPARLKRSATTISSAHRLRTRLMSQDPTTCSSAPTSAASTPSKRPRSPAREALHASVSKHLTSRSVSRSSAAAAARTKSNSSAYSSSCASSSLSKHAPSVPAPAVAPVAPVVPTAKPLANPHLIVATLLVRIAQANDALLERATPLASTDCGAAALLSAASKFQGRAPPTISLPAYAARLARYAPVPAAVWVATLIAIDRVANAPTTSSSSVDGSTGTAVPPVVVCSHNVHRVLLLALAIATKVHSDAFYTNKHLAKVGGVGLAELNRLELEFLFLSGFNVNVSDAEYTRYTERLAAYAGAVQQQWAAKVAATAAKVANAGEAVARVHSVDLDRAHQRHEPHHVQQRQHQHQQQQQHAKSAPAALGVLVSPPCSPTPSCSSLSSSSSSSSSSSTWSCYSAGAVVCTAPGQRQVVWSTPPMSPPRHLMAPQPMVLSPMAVDQRE